MHLIKHQIRYSKIICLFALSSDRPAMDGFKLRSDETRERNVRGATGKIIFRQDLTDSQDLTNVIYMIVEDCRSCFA